MEHTKAAQIDLTKHGLTGVTEVLRNPSYEQLFVEETLPGLETRDKLIVGTADYL